MLGIQVLDRILFGCLAVHFTQMSAIFVHLGRFNGTNSGWLAVGKNEGVFQASASQRTFLACEKVEQKLSQSNWTRIRLNSYAQH